MGTIDYFRSPFSFIEREYVVILGFLLKQNRCKWFEVKKDTVYEQYTEHKMGPAKPLTILCFTILIHGPVWYLVPYGTVRMIENSFWREK